MMNKSIRHFETPFDVAKAAAKMVEDTARECIAHRGAFHWALAGGTTPKRCYELLCDADIDWAKVHVWFGDERCLPVGDAERNDVMADEALLNHVAIPKQQVHRMHAELGAEQAAMLYADALASIDALDLVLLGIGEDGHTASLFPNNPALANPNLAVPVFNSPKPPSDRVSIGYKALKSAHKRVIMVTGESKRDAFEKICADVALPVNIDDSEWYVAL